MTAASPTPKEEIATPAVGMPKRVWIMLEESDDIPPTGLFIGHNGTGYLLRAGEPVPVPECILGVLDDAVASYPVTNPSTGQVSGYRERRRFNYRRVDAPPDVE